MQLQYLDFDFSDEESGRGSFDAMAAVNPSRLPALLAEVQEVLRWAVRAWGPARALQDEGEWDYALHGTIEPDTPLELVYDERRGEVPIPSVPGSLLTVTLTVSGSPAFCRSLREAFALDD